MAYSNTLPSISSSKNEYWYHIISGKQEYKHKCITDVTTTSNNSIKFEVKDIAPENDNQLWKVILPINTASGTFLFVNKLTGNIIQTHYEEYNGNYCVQATTSQAATNKWKIKHLDFDQFIISGINSQGYEGYLNVSPSTKPAHFPASTDLLGSAYAWIFEKVETNGSAIEDVTTADPFEHISIHTANGRIIVEGTNQYTITGLSGMVCEKEQQLSPGVYLITIQGKSVAYLVK